MDDYDSYRVKQVLADIDRRAKYVGARHPEVSELSRAVHKLSGIVGQMADRIAQQERELANYRRKAA